MIHTSFSILVLSLKCLVSPRTRYGYKSSLSNNICSRILSARSRIGRALLGQFLLLTVVCTSVLSQQLPSDPVDDIALYIMLFHSFASQAEKQEPHSRSVEIVARQARQLSIDVKDIHILEDCLLTFKQREEELRAEALTYHKSQRKLARKADPKIVHTFAERRSQLVSLTALPAF